MKKTIVWSLLFTAFYSQAFAENPQKNTEQQTHQIQTTQPKQNETNTQNSASSKPTAQSTAEQQPIVINCNYKIPAENKTIDSTLILEWAEKATLQSFSFSPEAVDNQIQQLQPCFTDQGWIGFNTALQKSGNVDSIKSQKLTLSSQIDGHAQVIEAKNNQWKVSLPLQVVYQNEKEKVTQLLVVSVTVGRKTNGDLGIMQLIATPRASQPQHATTDSSSSKGNSLNVASTPVSIKPTPEESNTNTASPEDNTSKSEPENNQKTKTDQ